MKKVYRSIRNYSATFLILSVAGLFLYPFSITALAAGLDLTRFMGKDGTELGDLMPGSMSPRLSVDKGTEEFVVRREHALALKQQRALPSKIEIEYQKRLQRETSFNESVIERGGKALIDDTYGEEPVVSFETDGAPAPREQRTRTGASPESSSRIPAPGGRQSIEDVDADFPYPDSQQRWGAADATSKYSVAKPGVKHILMKQKYVRMALMKRNIEKQLSDLMRIDKLETGDVKDSKDSKDLRDLKAKLQKQLVGLTDLESKYNDNDFLDLNDDVAKTIRTLKGHDLVSDRVRRLSKPITVSGRITQFGYQFFYGEPLPPNSPDVPTTSDYIIGAGDELRIFYYGSVKEEKNFVVDQEGSINLTNEAPVKVAGLTFAEMEAKVQNIIKTKMIGVSARVIVGHYRSIRVFMLGDVSLPGACLVSGMSTVSGALLACGGVEKIGSLRKIGVIRNGKKIGTFDLYDFMLKGDTSRDPFLKAGDAVFIPPIQNTAAIAGEVNRPAIYEFSGAMSLDELVNNAGGARPTSLTQLAQIERIDGQGSITTIDVNLASAERHMAIRNGDIVKVFSLVDGSLNANALYFIGNVRNSGKRAFQPGMRVGDLLEGGAALLPNTYLEYGVIERESGVGRETEMLHFNPGKLLSGKEGENPALMPRDRVYIFNSSEFAETESAQIEGLVNIPGKYAVKKNMTVADLVLAAGGVQDDADLEFAELYREDPVSKATTLLKLNLEGAISMRGEANPALQANDRLVVHSVWERHIKNEVTIMGEITKSGTYPLPQDARLLDLIYAAGGLTEKAYKKKVEITRYEIHDGKEMESNHFEVDVEAALRGSAKDNIRLEKYDQVIIRPISHWGETEYVTLKGEVMFPGKYIVQKGETLSSAIKRAGGFSDDAFVYGARFTRISIAEMQKKEYEEMANRLDKETSHMALAPAQLGSTTSTDQKQMMIGALKAMAEKLRHTEGSGRIIVNVPPGLKDISKEDDLALEDGDTFYVPKKPDTVMVMGAVYNPNAFQYHKSSGVETYINRAGGYNEQANQSATNVVKANGEVVPLRGGYFQKKATLGPGDIILVPETVAQYSSLQITQDITTILYQLSLTAAGLKTIGVFK